MHCHKMHATITVARCLANREAKGGFNRWRDNEDFYPRYAGCKDCDQGILAAEGKLNDGDIEELMQRISEERGEIEMGEKPVVDGKKKCATCGETRPIEDFARKVTGSEARRSRCSFCVAEYQAKRRAIKKAEKASIERVQEEPTPTKAPAPACIQEEGSVPELVTCDLSPVTAPGHILILDFSVYPQVLDEIKRLANDQERPPEVQARYMLRHIMRGSEPPWRMLDLGYHFDKGGNTL